MTHCRFRIPCHLSLLALLACAGLPLPVIAQQPANVSKSAAAVITARACRVQPGDAADIPSPERGPLLKLLVEQGSVVQQGDVLAELDQDEALLALKLAEQELQAAQQKQASSRLGQVA
ncbi:MAG: biotin/lipoyl-binding protein, partial [Planctomyces sp.]